MAAKSTPIIKFRSNNHGSVQHKESKSYHPDTIPLSLALQTSLDLETMLQIFLHESRKSVEIDGLSFRSSNPTMRLQIDRGSHHSCSYHLDLHGESLGEVIFSRRRRFNEEEMEKMEYLLSAILYPLRNALTHSRAVQAAQIDPLTGIHNRLAMNGSIEREIQRSRRQKQPLALMVLDLDHFKRVNDTYGHATGDRVLVETSKIISEGQRLSDQLFRFGGEEFVMLLPDTSIESARHVADRIREQIQSVCIESPLGDIRCTISIGISEYQEGDCKDLLFERADSALYQAKSNGRNCVELIRSKSENTIIPNKFMPSEQGSSIAAKSSVL